MGEMLGWQIKAKQLTEATSSKSLAVISLKARKSEFILSLLKGMEMMRVRLEMMSAPIATVLNLKTYFRSGRKLRAANRPRKMSLKPFYDRLISPE